MSTFLNSTKGSRLNAKSGQPKGALATAATAVSFQITSVTMSRANYFPDSWTGHFRPISRDLELPQTRLNVRQMKTLPMNTLMAAEYLHSVKTVGGISSPFGGMLQVFQHM